MNGELERLIGETLTTWLAVRRKLETLKQRLEEDDNDGNDRDNANHEPDTDGNDN